MTGLTPCGGDSMKLGCPNNGRHELAGCTPRQPWPPCTGGWAREVSGVTFRASPCHALCGMMPGCSCTFPVSICLLPVFPGWW